MNKSNAAATKALPKKRSAARKPPAPRKVAATKKAKSSKNSGVQLALIANILWGTSFLASRETLMVWSPIVSTAIRFLCAMIVMALVLPRFGFSIQVPKGRKAWAAVVAVGLAGFGILYPLQLHGMTFITSGLSAAIMLTSPIFVILLSAAILKEKLAVHKIVAVILGAIGGVILLAPNTSAAGASSGNLLTGSLLMLGASLALALSVIFTRKFKSGLNAQSLTFWSMGVGLLVISPFVIRDISANGFTKSTDHIYTASIAMAYLVVACSAVAFVLWNRAIEISQAKDLASSMHVKTPIAILLGCLVVGESLTFSIILGSALVAIAVATSQYEFNIRKAIVASRKK